MTVSGPASHAGEPSAAALLEAGDITGLMRACHERRLEREGIPMVLGLADERGSIPLAAGDAQLAEGRAFAEVLDRYAAALVPFARPDDEGAVITAMQVLGFTHFAPGAEAIRDDLTIEPGTDLSTDGPAIDAGGIR